MYLLISYLICYLCTSANETVAGIQQTEHKTTNVENPVVQNNEKQIVEEDKIESVGTNKPIKQIIRTAHRILFDYYNGQSEFEDTRLNKLFKVSKNLGYEVEDIFAFEATVATIFDKIENDLELALQDKGMKIYLNYEYKKLEDIYEVRLVDIDDDDRTLISPEPIFKIIYDKYKTEYLNKNLHLIEIAKEFKNIIIIYLFQLKQKEIK